VTTGPPGVVCVTSWARANDDDSQSASSTKDIRTKFLPWYTTSYSPFLFAQELSKEADLNPILNAAAQPLCQQQRCYMLLQFNDLLAQGGHRRREPA
jgi:hypothetical protein